MSTDIKTVKTYLVYFACVALIPIAVFGGLGFFLEPISGDLTRVGKLSERDFGWNAPQPKIQIAASDRSLKPDIVVIGDSFSATNTWQTVAMQETGLKIFTFNWLSLGHPSCLESWLETISKDYPTVKTVIVETIERSVFDRFNSNKAICKRVSAAPSAILAKSTDVTRDEGVKEIMPDPVYAIYATVNTFKKFHQSTNKGRTVIEPLTRSDLFSNRRSDLLLHYRDDYKNNGLNKDDIKNSLSSLTSLNTVAKRNNLNLLVAVVPNKSSVYAPYFKVAKAVSPTAQLAQEMQTNGIPIIDLLSPFLANVETIPDLYFSNDTHLSTKGYVLMGQIIGKLLVAKK
jgi:hypothetical protein